MVAVLLASVPALAADFNVPPTPTHFVTDNAGALSGDTRASVEGELQAYEKATGHQVIVWIGQTTGDVPLETWTGETAHQWKIGRKGHDDGAVLFLFMKDHRIRIEVGYGLESSLTDADAHRIIEDDVTPRMKAGDPDGAVSSAVAAMLATISPSYQLTELHSPAPSSDTETEANPIVFFLFVALFVCVGIFFAVVIVSQILGVFRYGYLVMREGSKKASKDMTGWWFWSGVAGAASGGGSDSFGGGSDDDFSAGGGDFGGGGASGSW